MSYDAKAFRIEHNLMDANGSGFVVELKNLMDIAEKLSHFALESKLLITPWDATGDKPTS